MSNFKMLTTCLCRHSAQPSSPYHFWCPYENKQANVSIQGHNCTYFLVWPQTTCAIGSITLAPAPDQGTYRQDFQWGESTWNLSYYFTSFPYPEQNVSTGMLMHFHGNHLITGGWSHKYCSRILVLIFLGRIDQRICICICIYLFPITSYSGINTFMHNKLTHPFDDFPSVVFTELIFFKYIFIIFFCHCQQLLDLPLHLYLSNFMSLFSLKKRTNNKQTVKQTSKKKKVQKHKNKKKRK